jgi:hypothetical protein
MSACGQTAVLIVTRRIEGTSTNVARRRVELVCGLSAGHAGPHHDAVNDERWDSEHGRRQTLLRHEDDDDWTE